MKRKILSAAMLCAVVLCGAVPFERSTEPAPDLKPKRAKLAPSVLMYPEVQYKYGLFQNFLHGYIDRPLFFDRATRYTGNFEYMTEESIVRDAQIMKTYGFNGGGNLSNAIYGSYVKAGDFMLKNLDKVPGYLHFPQFAFGESGKYNINQERSARVLRYALSHKEFMPTINGKIPLSVYNASYIELSGMQKFLNALRKEFGDTFSVVCDLRPSHLWVSEYKKNGNLSPGTVEEIRKRLEAQIKVYDGFQLHTCHDVLDKEYLQTPHFEIFDRYIEPMVMEIMGRPENKEKLLVGFVQHGYINHMSGVNRGEYGTYRMRGMLNRLARANCDMIFFFEWNEFNENTCWQPTLYNSLVLQRLVRYYSNVMRGESPRPNPNDDLNVPPFALSYRETLKLGEVLRFELLNIPDTLKSSKYDVKLELLDKDGKSLHVFPVETFDRGRMDVVNYAVPTEALAKHVVIHPRLTVTGADGRELKYDGFQYIRLLPTFCYNYKDVRHSLRDILKPAKVEFTAQALGNGQYRLKGMIKTGGEKLSSFEVTDFGREVFAVDHSNEFDRSKYEIIVGDINTRASGARPVYIEVSGTDDWDIREWGFPNVTLRSPKREGKTVDSQWPIWAANSRFIMKIAKADAAKTVIRFNVDDETKEFAVADIMKYKTVSHAYPKCRLDWVHYQRLPDIAPRINAESAAFDTVVTSDRQYPVYQVRAVTTCGRIYRSDAVIPRAIPAETEKLNVVSSTTGEVVTLDAYSALIPKMDWQVDPAAGDMLLNSFDSYFRCDLGGGYTYNDAFHGNIKPAAGSRHAPKFIQDEKGRYMLDFDGKTYLHFPVEVFPRGSFTLKFSVRPEPDNDTKNYVLFRHYGGILGSVTVYSKFDRICFAFGDRQLNTHHISTAVDIPAGKWSDVEIAYDFKNVTIKVDGKGKSYPLPKAQALYFRPGIFGGHTKVEFGLPSGSKMFKGKLRSISIYHNAVEK
ncbi:MAG: hypothetical protein IKA71_06105 [Lentisphaeria bacterium]|nr:hypothetical protein [Lentisphaeria bacterium]